MLLAVCSAPTSCFSHPLSPDPPTSCCCFCCREWFDEDSFAEALRQHGVQVVSSKAAAWQQRRQQDVLPLIAIEKFSSNDNNLVEVLQGLAEQPHIR